MMARIDLYLKVEADLGESEEPRRFAAEVCRQIMKIYGVRSAELSNYVSKSEEESSSAG
jgi:hypothetical protein